MDASRFHPVNTRDGHLKRKNGLEPCLYEVRLTVLAILLVKSASQGSSDSKAISPSLLSHHFNLNDDYEDCAKREGYSVVGYRGGDGCNEDRQRRCRGRAEWVNRGTCTCVNESTSTPSSALLVATATSTLAYTLNIRIPDTGVSAPSSCADKKGNTLREGEAGAGRRLMASWGRVHRIRTGRLTVLTILLLPSALQTAPQPPPRHSPSTIVLASTA
ncbi:hypothetical protein BDQ17DRAFT_1513480 [Cyathus striatus]|nr:hypothetical protein BDQ17DRAFT_1513480 [Cyathus striatus]